MQVATDVVMASVTAVSSIAAGFGLGGSQQQETDNTTAQQQRLLAKRQCNERGDQVLTDRAPPQEGAPDQLPGAREQQQAVTFNLDHFSKHCIGRDVSESGDSPINGELPTATLCQGIGADVFRAMRSWASQESLLQKYCSGSCQNNRLFQGRSMSSRDAAMYTVLAIRHRLTAAVKDPACACGSCGVKTVYSPHPPAPTGAVITSVTTVTSTAAGFGLNNSRQQETNNTTAQQQRLLIRRQRNERSDQAGFQ
jgi:hypothetical protein